MLNAEPVIGREREIAQLDLAIGPGDDGLRLVMLSGPSGRGKTTLANVVSERAIDRGFDVRVANGRAGSLSTRFAPWLEAVPELVPTALPGVDVEHLGPALIRELTAAASSSSVLLVCDDIQAFDESSLALLPYASGATEGLNLTVLLIEQTDAIGVSSYYRQLIASLLSQKLVQHIELGPMTDHAIADLVRSVLDLDAADQVPAELIVRAQGNPWFARELSASWSEGGADLPVSIAAAATARLYRLDERAQDVLNAIAVCQEGAHIGWLDLLADQRPREFVRTMEQIRESGLVREDGEFVSIIHPLMRQAVLDELSAAMRRALHSELAEIIPSVDMPAVLRARAMGYHLACAGRPDDAIEQFLRAVEENEVSGQLHEALFDYARTLDIEPRIEQRLSLLRRAAFMAMQLNDSRAEEYWAELARLAAARSDDDGYAHALYQQYWTNQDGTALDRLERAASLGADRYGWSARSAATLSTLSGDYARAVEHDERALQLAQDSGDVILETIAREKLGLSYAYLERLPEAISNVRQAMDLAVSQRLHSWALYAWTALAECQAENLETTASVDQCLAALAYADELDLVTQRPWVLAFLALAQARAGDVAGALVSSERANHEARTCPDVTLRAFATGVRSQVTAQLGQPGECAHVVDEAIRMHRQQGYHSWLFEAEFHHAQYLCQVGRIEDGLKFLDGQLVDEPVAMACVAQWLVRLGLVEDRLDLVQRALEIVAPISSGIPLVELIVDEVVGTHAAFTAGDLAALAEVVDRWKAAERPLDVLRSQLSLAIAEAKHEQREQALERLRELRKSCGELGLEYDVNIVSARLRSLGARSRASSNSTTVGNLTARELEIARLVASGLRNAEVATQLHLAEKTVAAHLSNIYGKVEVKSRLQLASWLEDNDAIVA